MLNNLNFCVIDLPDIFKVQMLKIIKLYFDNDDIDSSKPVYIYNI